MAYVSKSDIYGAAQALINKHGEAASTVVASEIGKQVAAENAEGAAVWRRILQAIGELLPEKPTGE